MSKYQKKNILIGGLLAIVVVMGIAYAAFASNLTITGTSTVNSNWCIGFDSRNTSAYEGTAGITGGDTPTGSISFSGDACAVNYKTNASLNASFKQPGDKVEYTLTIANKGSLNAAIESINVDGSSVTSNQTITKGNIKFIIEMPETTTLAVNAETTMKVTAMFQNDTEVTSATNEQQTINIAINAVQDDGNGGFTPTPSTFTGSIYRWSTTYLANKGTSSASNYPYTIADLTKGTDYITESDYPTYSARATALGKQYYLKHTIVNDEITESYVCFVYNNAEHCMKGGVIESSSESKPVFDANTQTIKDFQSFNNLPNNANPGCYFDSSSSYCYGGGFYYVDAKSYGYVYVKGSSSERCDVHPDGDSACYQ